MYEVTGLINLKGLFLELMFSKELLIMNHSIDEALGMFARLKGAFEKQDLESNLYTALNVKTDATRDVRAYEI